MLMRIKQLYYFGMSYGSTNLFQFMIATLIFFIFQKNDDVYSCMNECARPLTNWGSFMIFSRRYAQIIQIQALIYFFYILPRKFIKGVTKLSDEDRIKIDESIIFATGKTKDSYEDVVTNEHRNTLPRQNRQSLGFGLIDEKSLTESMIKN